MSVNSILVSQPRPENEKSPYFALADKYKLKIDFRSFIHIEGIEKQEFRKKTKINKRRKNRNMSWNITMQIG